MLSHKLFLWPPCLDYCRQRQSCQEWGWGGKQSPRASGGKKNQGGGRDRGSGRHCSGGCDKPVLVYMSNSKQNGTDNGGNEDDSDKPFAKTRNCRAHTRQSAQEQAACHIGQKSGGLTETKAFVPKPPNLAVVTSWSS